MTTLEDDVRSVISVLSPDRLAHRLLADAAEGARCAAAIYLDGGASGKPAFTVGNWDGLTILAVPLTVGERQIGTLALGRRQGSAGFSARETKRLQEAANLVAVALAMSADREMVTA